MAKSLYEALGPLSITLKSPPEVSCEDDSVVVTLLPLLPKEAKNATPIRVILSIEQADHLVLHVQANSLKARVNRQKRG